MDGLPNTETVSSSPDERSGDGQDGPDEPRWVSDDETFQILSQSAREIHIFMKLSQNVHLYINLLIKLRHNAFTVNKESKHLEMFIN